MLLEVAQAAQDYLATPPGIADQITAAGLSVWIIQKAKCSNLPYLQWINQHSDQVNRIVSLGFAMASTLGIHAIFERGPEHKGVLTISGIPELSEITPMVWKVAGSFMIQQGWYLGLIKHEKGQAAVDSVAERVEEKKDAIADEVVKGSVKQDPNAILKLRPGVLREQAQKIDDKKSGKSAWDWEG